MKNNIILTAGLSLDLLVQNNVQPQSSGLEDFGKGTDALNAGIGHGSYGLSGNGGLPIKASFERGLSKKF